MPTITIDPKMFINKPFIKCPKCGKKSFGVLSIYSSHYVRRCSECWHDESFKLPPVHKKIIYLDQFAISEMMKSINPSLNKMSKVDPFFKKLFEILDRLNKLQLIVCPESTNHFDESFVSPYYPALKRMYQQLAHNFSFYDPDTIKRFQILEDFNGWIGSQKQSIDIGDVLTGTDDLEGWQDRFVISVSLRDQDPMLANELRQARDKTSEFLVEIFKRWQIEKSKTFKDWYEEERSFYGPSLVRPYLEGLFEFDNIGNLMSNVSVIMTEIHKKLTKKGLTDEEGLKKSIEYFKSESLKNISYVQLSSILFASLAREAAFGRKKLPTRGMMNDVEFIACYAPYCDAMFIDKECRRLLEQGLLEAKYSLKTKIFAQDNKEEFLKYLEEIEKSISKKHLEKVKEVYGENWPTPYINMFLSEIIE